MYVVYLVLSALAAEALTELFTKSAIFSTARQKLSDSSDFLKKLISCGYCFSVWAALPFAIAITTYTGSLLEFVFILIFNLLLIHRLSNYLHNFNDKFLDKFYDPKFKQ